jgi:hypothetical protein
MLIARRSLLRGLFAIPAIVAASSLMPLRGISLIMPSELTDAEIIALLDKRLDDGMGGWNEAIQQWCPPKYTVAMPYARFSAYQSIDEELGLGRFSGRYIRV